MDYHLMPSFFRYFFCLLFPASIFISKSQVYHVVQPEGIHQFKNYTPEEGLANPEVAVIFQDSRGYMWFGTRGGVSCFDGVNFVTYNTEDGLADNVVYGITEDENKNMWFGTHKGLCRFDGKTFITYTIKNGLQHNHIWSLKTKDKHSIWVGTARGVALFYPERKTEIMCDTFEMEGNRNENETRAIYKDDEGNWWFGAAGRIFKFENGKMVKKGYSGYTHGIAIDDQSRVWIARWGNDGLGYFEKGKSDLSRTFYKEFQNASCTNMMKDHTGAIWVTTWEKGVLCIKNDTILNYTTREGLPSNCTWALCEDREGNVWIGTWGNGVCRFSGDRFTIFNEDLGTNNASLSYLMHDRKGRMWTLTDDGVICLDKTSGKKERNYVDLAHQPNFTKLTGIAIDQNNKVYVSMYGGGGYVIENFKPKYADWLGGYSMLLSRKNEFWLGGALHLHSDKQDSVFAHNPKESQYSLPVLEDKNGYIWSTVTTAGIRMWDGEREHFYGRKEGFCGHRVSSAIHWEGNKYWFATSQGVFLAELRADKLVVIDSLKKADGMTDERINDLQQTQKEFIWIFTTSGISKFNLAAYQKEHRKIFTHFGKHEGLTGVDCRFAYKDSGNYMWINTPKGLIYFNLNADSVNTTAPLVNLRSIRLFYKDVDWTSFSDSLNAFTGIPKNLTLPYDQNHLSFSFRGICMAAPEAVKYKWILKGLDKDWSPVSSATEISYSSLEPGEYTFMVMACNNSGLWSNQPASFHFNISPPFWKNNWFRIPALCFILILIYVYVRYRERKLRESKRKLEQLVEERTYELQMQKEIVEEKNKEMTDSIKYASRIQRVLFPTESYIEKQLRKKKKG